MNKHEKSEKLADDILLTIRKQRGRKVAASSLSKKFKASIKEVDESLKKIKDWGYRLKISKDHGVTFMAAPDVLSDTEISFGLKSKLFGKNILAYRKVKSTNDLADDVAEKGAVEGTIITTEQQTSGRGRLGRSWHSPPGSGIYVSFIIRPGFSPENAPGISVMTALALAETLAGFCPGKVKIKWPNDVMISDRKVAGILTELSAEKGKINHLIVGVGINVNQKKDDFPEELRKTATSLRLIMRKKVRRAALLQNFLKTFEKEYSQYKKTHLKKANRRLRRYSYLLNRTITLVLGKEKLTGKVIDIDGQGRLIIERDGKKEIITNGEVTITGKD